MIVFDIKKADVDVWRNWKHDAITKEFMSQLKKIRDEICDINGRRLINCESGVANHNVDVGYVSCLQDLIEEIQEIGREEDVPQNNDGE